MAVVNLELHVLLLFAGMVAGLIAWLVGTFTHWLREYRYRVALGLIAFPLSGLMGFVSTLHVLSMFTEWQIDFPIRYVFTVAYCGYVLFGFLGCWTIVRIAGRWDRKHTLQVLYNLVRERKNSESDS
jgi:hypothetical protein